jgi:protoporphyrinogen oxidase
MSSALIIGAGPAGLSAGYELVRLGIDATVVEADDQVGGLARTINHGGYRFDIGGHRFFSKVPLINAMWHDLLGEDFLLRPRLSRIHYRGRYFDYPLRPLNALHGLGPVEALRVCLSYAGAQLLPRREERSLEEWVSNRFGARLYEIFFKTYTEKVWGLPCSEISADWAAQRIKNLSLGEALRSAVFNTAHDRDGALITSLIERFHYPRFGPGMMWERCAQIVREQGGTVLTGLCAERIRHRNGRAQCVQVRNRQGESVELAADYVISTLALRDLVGALDPPPPDHVLRAANALRYRDYLTVVLIVKRATVFEDNWIYVHTPGVRLGRVQNYKNWSPEMVPDPSRTSLGLEYFLWDGDQEWGWPRERLIETGVRDCLSIGLIDRNDVEDGTVLRVSKAYPVYDHHYRDHLTTVRGYLDTISNLQTVGRNGQHRYNNQDHSMLGGIYAARNVAGAEHDVWSINTEAEYLEEADVSAAASGERAVPSPLPATGGVPQPASEDVLRTAFAHVDPVALGAAFGVVVGIGIFLATAVLLIKGGPIVGPTLLLLGQYLPGYRVSWGGALIGMLEAGAGGYVLGYSLAKLRNWGLTLYALLVRRRASARARRDMLGRI